MTVLTAPVVEAVGLSQVFGDGDTSVAALDDVDIEVASGEVVLVEGPSGSGKTTLISILGGLLRPTRGRVVFAGNEIDWRDSESLDRLRAHMVGMVYQSFNLLEPLTAVQNVEVAANAANRKGADAHVRARGALDRLGLARRADLKAAALSSGERQRVALARALINDPKLILADEPTGNLDADNGREVGLLLATLADEGRAVIVATHDPRLHDIGTRRLRLVDGRLIE